MASFDLPYFGDAPYFEQYLGLWAIEESALQAHVEALKKLNLALHLQSDAVAAVRSSRGVVEAVKSDQVAVLSLTGSLMKQASSMSGGTSTAMARQAIRGLVQDSEISAIVLKIDSPGGTVAGTEELAADIAKANQQKPVFAFIEDLGASAAYWLASQASEISANATALVGSIGTYGVVQDLSAMAAKEGVKVHVVKAGAYKGAGVPGTEVTAEHLAEMQARVDALNAHFLAGVAKGRQMPMEKVQALADGRVHIAAEAKSLGLIDQISSLDETIARAQAAARKRKPMAASGSSVTSKGGQRMSQELTASVEETKPAAASIEQIESACPGAPDSFVLAQVKRGATLEQASNAWLVQQANDARAEAAAAKAEAAQLKADLEKSKSTQSTGVEAIGSVSIASTVSSNATEQWNQLLSEKRKAGMDPASAILAVAKENPGLREQVNAEANAAMASRRR